VVQAFKILTSDKQVKAILVNIFGASALFFATPAPRGCLPQNHHEVPASPRFFMLLLATPLLF